MDPQVKLELLSAVTDFYIDHAPKYAGKAGTILRKYRGREDFIWRSLFAKYGAVPEFDLGRVNKAFARPGQPWDRPPLRDDNADSDDGGSSGVDAKRGGGGRGREANTATNAIPASPDKGVARKPGKASRRVPAVDTQRRAQRGAGGRTGGAAARGYGSSSEGNSISPTVRNAARRSAIRAASKSPSRSSNEGSGRGGTRPRVPASPAYGASPADTSSASSSASEGSDDSDGHGGVDDANYDDNDGYDATYGVVKLTAAQQRAQEMARKLLNAAIQVPRATNAPWGVGSAAPGSGSPRQHGGGARGGGGDSADEGSISEDGDDDDSGSDVGTDSDGDIAPLGSGGSRQQQQQQSRTSARALARPESRSGRDTRALRQMEQQAESAAILHDMRASSSVLKLLRASRGGTAARRALGAVISGSSGSGGGSGRNRAGRRAGGADRVRAAVGGGGAAADETGRASGRAGVGGRRSGGASGNGASGAAAGRLNRGVLGRNEIVLAADRGDLDFFHRALLEGGQAAAREIRECRGMGLFAPLHFAARQGHSAVVHLLVSDPRLRCDPNVHDKNLETPAHLAAGSGSVRSLDFLLDARADPNAVNKEEETPLFAASRKGHSGALRCLLQFGADPSLKNRFGELPAEESPLGWARDLLLEHGGGGGRSSGRSSGGGGGNHGSASAARLLPSAAVQAVAACLDVASLAAAYAVCSRWRREVGASEAWRASQQVRQLQWQSLTRNPFGDTAMANLLRPSSVGSPPGSAPGGGGGGGSFSSRGGGASRKNLTTAPSRLGGSSGGAGLGGLGIGMLGGRTAFGSPGGLGFLGGGSGGRGGADGSKLAAAAAGGAGGEPEGKHARESKQQQPVGRSTSSRSRLVFSSPSGGDFF